MTTLVSHLSATAAEYAKRALEAYASERTNDFQLFGGLAIEFAVKAKLARVNPLFIAPERSFESALALHNASQDVSKLPPEVTTIGASAAVRRLSHVDGELGPLLKEASHVIALRNDTAHLGIRDERQRQRNLVAFLRTIEALLAIDPADFWKPHHDLVVAMLDGHAAEVKQTTAALLVAARLTFESRYGSLNADVRAAALSFVRMQRDLLVDGDETLAADCPACGSAALAVGTSEQTGFDVDVDRDGTVEGAYPTFTFNAESLECDACGLTLEEPDALEAAGIPRQWENDQIDVIEWMRESYGPDDEW